MAKKNYVVKRAGTYGIVGRVFEKDFGKDGLTDRQKLLIKEYKKPVVKVDNTEELKSLKSDLEVALSENKKLKSDLEVALKPKEK